MRMERKKEWSGAWNKGWERLSRFTLLLMNEKRYDDAEKVLKDKEYRDKMFKRLGV